jgi:signal peptidase II
MAEAVAPEEQAAPEEQDGDAAGERPSTSLGTSGREGPLETSGREGPLGTSETGNRRPAEDHVPGAVRRNRAYGYVLAFLVFLMDQATKWVVTFPLQLKERKEIEITGFFNLRWVENRGVSMGALTATSETMRWGLVALTTGIAIFVAIWLWREKRRDDAWGLALVLGGALGNIVDRIRFGFVVDFADLHFGEWKPFLVFNVADAAITVGVLLLLLRALLTPRKSRKPKGSA